MSNELVRRIARRYIRVAAEPQAIEAINHSLAAVTVWKNDLASMSATLEALIAAGEARRLGRTADVKVASATFDGNRIQAVVKGVTDTYQTRVTLKPKRGHHCTCPDWAENGTRVGPCKHVLALGRYWLATKVNPALDIVADKLADILEKSDL